MELLSRAVDVFQSALAGLHDLLEPTFQEHAWGWAIIALTLVIRLLLLPLAIKQIRSMRAMQAIQPQMKELQKKYKVDRDLMKKDPEQYKAKKQKLNEEMMALYQEEGVNPMASCLPLLAQAPVFLALFRVLQGERAEALTDAPFYFITGQSDHGLTSLVSNAGWPGWLLIVLMAATMFISQKQMMARQATSGADNPMAQQQKIMLYAMPVVLAAISFNLPLGVLLYWVTTNLWQAVQQWFMLREVQHEVEEGTLAEHPGGEAAARFKLGKGKGNGNGKGNGKGKGKGAPGAATKGKGGATSGKGGATSGKGGATSGKGGATSGKAGTTAGTGGVGDAEPTADGETLANGKGRSAKGKGGTPAGGSRGKSGGAASPGPRPNGAPRPSGRSKSDHIPRRGDRR